MTSTGITPPNNTDRVFQAIARFIAAKGYGPTYREIMIDAELSTTSLAQYHVGRLIAAGWIRMEPDKSRTIQLTTKGKEAAAKLPALS